jgi:hypothetical protein
MPAPKTTGLRLQSMFPGGGGAAPTGLLGCGIAVRLRMEGGFGAFGERLTRSAAWRWAALALVLALALALGAGLSAAHVETSVPKLWVESGGRLDTETDYYNAHNNKGQRVARDPGYPGYPGCLVCAGPASGGETPESAACSAGAAGDEDAGTSVSSIVELPSLSGETSTGGGSPELIIIAPETRGADVIGKTSLQAVLKLHKHISDIAVCFDKTTGARLDCVEDCGRKSATKASCVKFDWDGSSGLDDLWGTAMCSKIKPPAALKGFEELVPCNRVTVLDCFKEGDYDWPSTIKNLLPFLAIASPDTDRILREDYGIVGYGDLPSIDTSSDELLHHAVTGGCRGFARRVPLMRWYNSLIIGNPVIGAAREIAYPTPMKVPVVRQGFTERADAFQSVFLLTSSKELASRASVTEEIAQAAVVAWRAELELLSKDQDLPADADARLFPSLKVSVLTSSALGTALAEVTWSNIYFSAIGITIMAAFVLASLVRYPAQCGCRDPATAHRDDPAGCGCGNAPLGMAGLLIVVLATVTAFGFSCWIGVSFNATSIQVLPFLALGLGVDDMFVLIHCYDTTKAGDSPVEKDRGSNPVTVAMHAIGRTMSRAGPSVTMTSMANFVAFLIGSTIPLPAVSSFCYMAAAVVFFNYSFLVMGLTPLLAVWKRREEFEHHRLNAPPHAAAAAATAAAAAATATPAAQGLNNQRPNNDNNIEHGSRRPSRQRVGQGQRLRDRCIDGYARGLLQPWSKVVVCVVSIAFLGTSIYFSTTVEDGLDISDIAPRGSALSRFLNDKTTFFSSFDVEAIVQQMDYPCRQKELHAFLNDLGENEWVSYVSDNNWIDLYTKFARKNSSNVTTVTDTGLEYVQPSEFYAGLGEWDADVPSALDYLSSQMSSFGYTEAGENAGPTWKGKGRLALSKVAFTVDGLNSTQAYADMIKSVRNVCAEAAKVSRWQS